MIFPKRLVLTGCLLAGSMTAGTPARAAFHLMQIEQIIGGVNGDVTAQAVQLRMRSSFQSVVSSARLVAVDAAGSNPIILKDLTTNVTNSSAGSTVLLATANFANHTDVPFAGDFTMTAIPQSYLAAGQLRFTDDFGTIYWSVSWGGAGFTGSTTGNVANDSNGTFGPAFAGALPTGLQSLKFTGAASALSTTNLADYALSAAPAVFKNNAGTNFTLLFSPADFDQDGSIDGDDLGAWRAGFGVDDGASTKADGDANGDANGDGADVLIWQRELNVPAATIAVSSVPEPAAFVAAVMALLATYGRWRKSVG